MLHHILIVLNKAKYSKLIKDNKNNKAQNNTHVLGMLNVESCSYWIQLALPGLFTNPTIHTFSTLTIFPSAIRTHHYTVLPMSTIIGFSCTPAAAVRNSRDYINGKINQLALINWRTSIKNPTTQPKLPTFSIISAICRQKMLQKAQKWERYRYMRAHFYKEQRFFLYECLCSMSSLTV